MLSKSFIVVILSLITNVTNAQLYIWHDEDGVKHVTTIPREGFNPDGTIKEEYNPDSFAYQRKHLEEELKQHEKEREKESLPEWKEPTTVTNTSNDTSYELGLYDGVIWAKDVYIRAGFLKEYHCIAGRAAIKVEGVHPSIVNKVTDKYAYMRGVEEGCRSILRQM